jgi:DNA-binding NarL/FixJ family response regulator
MNRTRSLQIVLVEDGEKRTPAHIASNVNGLHYTLHVVQNIGEVFSLSMGHDIDVIVLDFVGRMTNDLSSLEKACESFSRIPVIVCLCNEDESERQRALRAGAQDVLLSSEIHSNNLAQSIRAAILRKQDYLWRHDHTIVQALSFLQQNPVSARRMLRCESFGMKPLSEAMPHKFLELSKSYSNVMELATTENGQHGARLSCQSVPRKLQFLASDLGSLKAGVNDVFELHKKALEHRGAKHYSGEEQQKKVLLELLSDLVSYYRRGEQLTA